MIEHVQIYTDAMRCLQLINIKREGGAMLENWLPLKITCCNPAPSGGSQPSVAPIPEDPVPFSDFLWALHACGTYRDGGRGILDSDGNCTPDWAGVM